MEPAHGHRQAGKAQISQEAQQLLKMSGGIHPQPLEMGPADGQQGVGTQARHLSMTPR